MHIYLLWPIQVNALQTSARDATVGLVQLTNSALSTVRNLAQATSAGSTANTNYLVPGDLQVSTGALGILAQPQYFSTLSNTTQNDYSSVRLMFVYHTEACAFLASVHAFLVLCKPVLGYMCCTGKGPWCIVIPVANGSVLSRDDRGAGFESHLWIPTF